MPDKKRNGVELRKKGIPPATLFMDTPTDKYSDNFHNNNFLIERYGNRNYKFFFFANNCSGLLSKEGLR
ncbi:MAG: hypothetical protein R2941_24295 [Desulfobacterales bacterium]